MKSKSKSWLASCRSVIRDMTPLDMTPLDDIISHHIRGNHVLTTNTLFDAKPLLDVLPINLPSYLCLPINLLPQSDAGVPLDSPYPWHKGSTTTLTAMRYPTP